MVSVLEADPGVGADLDPVDLPAARREALAPLLVLERGRWSWAPRPEEMRGHLGLLVLEGLLVRSEMIGALEYPELLGAGDVLRPWAEASHATLHTESTWEVLVPARIAVLDSDFAQRAKPWPEIVATLLERSVMRARALSLNLAIRRAVRIEERLELMLWHLADRWGHVTADGTVLPIPLTHDSLGKLVGARRSPVTVALGKLRDKGAIRRGPKGSWVLSGDPSSGLGRRLGGQPAPPPSKDSG